MKENASLVQSYGRLDTVENGKKLRTFDVKKRHEYPKVGVYTFQTV